MSLYDLAALNEIATQMMAEGKYAQGATILSQGLKQLDDYFQNQDASTKYPQNEDFCPPKMLCLNKLEFLDNSDEVSPGNTYDFLRYGFSVKSPCHTIKAEKFHAILASIMTSNLAIIHHQAALTNGASIHFKLAMRLYQQVSRDLKEFTDESASILLLVLTANMAHIHAHFWNGRQAQACIQCAIGFHALVDEEELPIDITQSLYFQSMFYQKRHLLAPAA